MTKSEFFTLLSRARSNPEVRYKGPALYWQSTGSIEAYSNGGFDDGQEDAHVYKNRRTVCQCRDSNKAKALAKYQTWLDQWRVAKAIT